MKRFHLYLISAQVIIDYLVILLSFTLAYFLRVGNILSTDFPFSEYFVPIVFVAPFWLIVMYFSRCYRLERRVDTYLYFQRLVFVVLVGLSMYAITFFFLRKFIFSRLILAYIFVIATVALYMSHYAFSHIAKRFYRKGVGSYPTLVIGTNREASKLVTKLINEHSIHKPVAILDGYGSKVEEIAGVPVLGKLNKLETVVEDHKIEQIIQADNLEQSINLINYALQNDLKYAMLPSLLGVYKKGHKVEMEGVDMIRVD